MSTIEELRAECERLYEVHNEVFQAWMDAQHSLEIAEAEEALRVHERQRARKYVLFALAGLVAGITAINFWI
jgi:hypothetical protein